MLKEPVLSRLGTVNKSTDLLPSAPRLENATCVSGQQQRGGFATKARAVTPGERGWIQMIPPVLLGFALRTFSRTACCLPQEAATPNSVLDLSQQTLILKYLYVLRNERIEKKKQVRVGPMIKTIEETPLRLVGSVFAKPGG